MSTPLIVDAPLVLPRIQNVIGVDFSGAVKAGENIWIARAEVDEKKLRLVALDRLADLAGNASRDVALARLVRLIGDSSEALWGIDFPFGLPIELGFAHWTAQLEFIRGWTGTTADFGRHCVDRARKVGDKLHIRRACDHDTPFDCYHYRIIYQTFHGIRDVLLPLQSDARTCVPPFNMQALAGARRVVAEACPGSTLRRLKLPFNNYKQIGGATLDDKRRSTRKKILAGIREWIEIDARFVGVTTKNLGGDALDAIIAAVGVWRAWKGGAVAQILNCTRASREGFVFA